jgi:hypothetical protein
MQIIRYGLIKLHKDLQFKYVKNYELLITNYKLRTIMNYLVAVLPEKTTAEAAYSALEQQGLSESQVNILGQGYKSADEFGLINPEKPARRQVNRLLTWLIPFGFIAGYAFNVLTSIEILPQATAFGNQLIAGLLGAASGALGAWVVGRLVGLTVGSGDALSYRNRLNAGKYLIIVQGNEGIIREATRVLRQFEPENIQGYANV